MNLFQACRKSALPVNLPCGSALPRCCVRRLSSALLSILSAALLVLSLAGQPLCAQAPAVLIRRAAYSVRGRPSAATANSASNINPATDADLAQYVGQYRSTSNPDQVNAIYLDGGVLYEESERRARQRLLPDALPGSADRFQIASPQAHVVFLRDATGAVSGLKFVLDSDGSTLVEEKRFSIADTRLNHFRQYTRQEGMLPMRDGVRLHAVILRPAHIEPGESLPFLLARTPYGVDDFDSESVSHDKPTGRQRLHLCLRGHPRAVWLGRQIRDEPPHRSPQQQPRCGRDH